MIFKAFIIIYSKGGGFIMELNEWIKKYVADDETQEELNKWDIEIATNKGIEQGIEQGKKEGIEQGRKEEKIETAKKLLAKNRSLEEIMELTELSEQEIMQLKEGK